MRALDIKLMRDLRDRVQAAAPRALPEQSAA